MEKHFLYVMKNLKFYVGNFSVIIFFVLQNTHIIVHKLDKGCTNVYIETHAGNTWLMHNSAEMHKSKQI